jgi:hypothetical protein
MERSVEARTQQLLQISIDLHDQMAELRRLREAVRVAGATARSHEFVHPTIIAQPISNELRV